MMQPMAIDLSVVIPVYNEAPNLEELHAELDAALSRGPYAYEVIFVDDGSRDESHSILTTLHARDPRHVRVVRFRRNFGQTAAFAAGFALARGRIIVTSDGDRQNDPSDIPALVARLDDGFDIVCGWRQDRKDTLLTRRVPSMLANALISRTTGVPLHDYGCSLKAFRAEVVKPLRLYGEMHRFIPALASEMGVRVTEQVVNHRARTKGTSKYGLSRTVRVLLDLLTVKFLLSYATRPLQMFGLFGLVLGLVGGVALAWLSYERLVLGHPIADRPLLLFGMLFLFAGMQLLTLGLLAEMQARTYHESQNKPVYVIRDVLEAEAPDDGGTPPPSSRARHAALRS